MNIGIVAFLAAFAMIFPTSMSIALGMFSTGIMYILATGGNMGMIPSCICEAYWDSYVIITTPLSVFTVNIMNTGKIPNVTLCFLDGIVGRIRGGMAQVNVLVSLIFSGMTGPAMADASSVGVMEIVEMKRQGYDDGFSCAITAASATTGPIFPPGMTMLLYSSLAGASVGALFMGGMLPGVILALFLEAYCLVVSYRRKYPYGIKYTIPLSLTYTLEIVSVLLTPAILSGGICGSAVTPTEADAVAGTYALIVSVLVYRMLSWESLKKILLKTARTVGTVPMTVGCTSAIVYISTLKHIPTLLDGFIMGIIGNRYVFLLICNVIFLILSMIFDNNTITLVFIPMVCPLVQGFGIDPTHFGVMFVINTMAGMVTPPYDPLLFVTPAISETPLEDIIKEILPMIAAMITFLLVITYIPDIILVFPEVFLDY